MIEGIETRIDTETEGGIDEKFHRRYSDSPLLLLLSYLLLLHHDLPGLELDHSHLPSLVPQSPRSHYLQQAAAEAEEEEAERFISKSGEALSSRRLRV